MRGAKNSQSNDFKFLTFMNGKFVERVPEGTNGAEPRTLEKGPNAGNVVHELAFDTYEGQIYHVETESTDYGQKLVLFMDISTPEDPEAKVKISMNLSSGPAKGLLSRFPNLDFSQDICLRGYHIEDKEKKRWNQFCVPYQNGEKVEPAFSKENPGELPPMEQIIVKGQKVWDDTKQLEFYKDIIDQLFGLPDSQKAEPNEVPFEPVEPDTAPDEIPAPIQGGRGKTAF